VGEAFNSSNGKGVKTMNMKALKAIDKSIEHWWYNLEILVAYRMLGEKLETEGNDEFYIWTSECALCDEFLPVCLKGCPITVVGFKECEYNEWSDVSMALHYYRTNESGENYKDLYQAVCNEIKMLYKVKERYEKL
jgi:hypothetical protein